MSRSAPRPALAIALSLLLASTPAFADGQGISKVNGSITAESGQQYGDLSTVNGSIRLHGGTRAGDADTVNGSIRGDDDVEVGSLGTVNGSIRLGTNARIDGKVETVNGSIFIGRGGSVNGSVSTVNGAIGLVAVAVDGNVETVSGDVTIGVDSRVTGDVRVSKPSSNWLPFSVGSSRRAPRIVVGPNAEVRGRLVFEREVTLYVHDSARIGDVSGATAVRYSGPRAPAD